MRQQLTEALAYPGLLVSQLVERRDYSHKSFYAATGQRCSACDGGDDCGWNRCLQDFRHRDEKTTEELGASLREGIKLVEALHNELRHNETTCMCETCCWIRNAEHLIEECEHHLPHVEPALHHDAP